MTRLRADFCLLLVAAIWGLAFVAQKAAMDSGIGAFSFVWLRFVLSFFVILPFMWREHRASAATGIGTILRAMPVCFVFVGAIVFQQVGMIETSVTNAGFITGLYVVFTPLFAWVIFKHRPSRLIWPACGLTIVALWFLNGGSFAALTLGDFWVLLCALFFGAHVALTGWFLSKDARPLLLVALQYLVCVAVALAGASMFEDLSWRAVTANWLSIFYAGVISGGIAYTLQAVAQQYTPPSNAAVILSGESVFAALTGVLVLGEAFTGAKAAGCGLILLAILCVEARAFFRKSM